jgi:hypothetical protein
MSPLHAPLEPAHALLGSAVGERLGDDLALRLPLQAVVADRRGGRQRLLGLARFEDLLHAVGAMAPDAGEAVGLQFEPHRQRIGGGPVAAALLRRVHLVGNAEQVLHVMTDFVRDHVSLGKLAGA